MLALYILTGIVLFLMLVCLIRVKFVLTLRDENRVDLHILFWRFPLYPQKNSVKVSKFTYKKAQKWRIKAEKRAQKKHAYTKKKAARSTSVKKKKASLKDTLSLYTKLLVVFYRRFSHHIRLDIARLHITVATGDAAQTAILTGIVSQSVAYICEFLDLHTYCKANYRKDVSVMPDYLAEGSHVDCRIVLSLRIWQILDIGARVAYRYIKQKISPQKARDGEYESE